MNRIRMIAAALITSLVAVLGIVLANAPAMAAGCTGASCQEGASVTVQASISETLTSASFSFNNGSPVTAGSTVGPQTGTTCPGSWMINGTINSSTPLCSDNTVNVQTADPAGYSVTAWAPDFTAGVKTLAVSNMNSALIKQGGNENGTTWNLNEHAMTNSSSSPIVLGGETAATGGSGTNWDQFDQLAIPGATANGSFTTTINLVAVAG